MPHLLLEYSDNVSPDRSFEALGESLHEALAVFETFKLADIKSRWMAREGFRHGNGDRKNAFVHLRLEILSGRPAALKKTVGVKLLELLKQEFAQASKDLHLDISLEIRDLDREYYFK